MTKVNLAELAKAGGGTRRKAEPQQAVEAVPAAMVLPIRQKSRENKVPITVQQPEQVRIQLKMLALEQGDTLENKVAEAFNDLFAKYSKPEIALIKPRKSRQA